MRVDLFFKTAFSYSYCGVEEFTTCCEGNIWGLNINNDYIEAIFRIPMVEPYMIHANAYKDMVYILAFDNKSFKIASCEKDKPIRHLQKVCAMITRYDPEILKSEFIRNYLNENGDTLCSNGEGTLPTFQNSFKSLNGENTYD